MARTGTRPIANKVNAQTLANPLNEKVPNTELNRIISKTNEPGLNDVWSSVVKFDDEYYPPEQTISTNTEYTINATNAGTGNGRCDQIISLGSVVLTFTGFIIKKSDITPVGDTITLVDGDSYTIVFLRRGAISEVYLTSNSGITPSLPVTFSNFRIDSANPDRVLFDASSAWTGSTFAGFTLASPAKTITAIAGSGTSSGHFTVSADYGVSDLAPSIDYDGTDDITSAGGDLAAFGSAQNITNNLIAFLDIPSNLANVDALDFDLPVSQANDVIGVNHFVQADNDNKPECVQLNSQEWLSFVSADPIDHLHQSLPLTLFQSDFTIIVKANITALTDACIILGFGTSSDGDRVEMYVGADQKFVGGLNVEGETGGYAQQATGTIAPNTDYFLAFVVSSANNRLYVDGVEQTLGTLNGDMTGIDLADFDFSGPFGYGTRIYDGGFGGDAQLKYLRGFRIYNYALTTAQIQAVNTDIG